MRVLAENRSIASRDGESEQLEAGKDAYNDAGTALHEQKEVHCTSKRGLAGTVLHEQKGISECEEEANRLVQGAVAHVHAVAAVSKALFEDVRAALAKTLRSHPNPTPQIPKPEART